MRIAINLNKKLHGDIKIYPEDHNDSYVICGIDRNGVNDENAVPDKDANLAMIMRAMPVVGGLCCQIDINRGKYLGKENAEKLKQYVKEYVQQSFPEVEITFVEET